MVEKNKKLDFDNEVERAINEESSDKELASEYVENNHFEQEAEKHFDLTKNNKETDLVLKKKIESLSEKACCSNNCCNSWNKTDLFYHAEEGAIETESDLFIIFHNDICEIYIMPSIPLCGAFSELQYFSQ